VASSRVRGVLSRGRLVAIFGWVFAAALAIGTLFLQDAVHAPDIVWQSVAVGALAVLGVILGVIVVDAGVRITTVLRHQPGLVADLVDCRQRAEALQLAVQQLEAEVDEAYEVGILEGKKRYGAHAIWSVRRPPKITGVYPAQGNVTLLAHSDPDDLPHVGQRFALVIEGSDELLGVIEVLETNPGFNSILVCVDRVGRDEYWASLADRPASDLSKPANVTLATYDADRHHPVRPRFPRPASGRMQSGSLHAGGPS